MKLIQFKHREDFGHELYIQILNTTRHWPNILKNWSVFQCSISWNDYPSWPYIQITSGSNGLLSILFWGYKFGFDIDLFSRTWNWDYMNKLNKDLEEDK